MFCDKQDCSPETIINNDMAAMFQITGILNAIAAVYYQKEQMSSDEAEVQMFFDMYQEVGLNIGKFFRLSTSFTENN